MRGNIIIPVSEKLSEKEEAVLGRVVRYYGKLSADQLSNLTHQPQTPWSRACDKNAYTEIDIKYMDNLRALRNVRLVNKA